MTDQYTNLEIEFLGTGSAFCDFRVNYHNNAVVTVGPLPQGKGLVLIDCGATAVQSLKELGYKVWEVEGVIITHLHGDHIGGLEQLLWERFYTGVDGPGFRKTAVYATREVLDLVRQALEPCVGEYVGPPTFKTSRGGYDALVDEVEVQEGSAFHFGQVAFRLHRTPHVVSEDGKIDKPAYGVEVYDHLAPDRGFYYTSDTTFRPHIGELFPEARIIFHDCTFGPKYPGTVHTHYEELLTLPEDVRARIILMHHTEVPADIDPDSDGFGNVAERHDHFYFG